MLPSRSLCRAAGKGWRVKLEDFFSWVSCWGRGKSRTVSNSAWGGCGDFVLLHFVFKPRISPAPSALLGARSWLCSEPLTHDWLCKGGRVFSELSVLVCQACAWKAAWKGKGFPERNAFSDCAKPVAGNSVLSCFWWRARTVLSNGLLIIFLLFFTGCTTVSCPAWVTARMGSFTLLAV